MTEIKLPTYKIIVPNEVYGKRAKSLESPLMENVPATQIIKLTRFRIPSKEEVIDYIRHSAGEIDFSPEKYKPLENDSQIALYLKSLPLSEAENIAKSKKNSLDHLRTHCPENFFQEDRVYLNAHNGIIPNPILDSVMELVPKEGTEVYRRAIEITREKEWSLMIRLEDGRFPDSLELEYLINRGVKDSDVFSVKGNFEDYKIVANQIRLLNATLGLTGLVSLIGDSSLQLLEQKAGSTVREMAQCVNVKPIDIIGIIGKAFNNFGEQQKKPFGYSEDCSLN